MTLQGYHRTASKHKLKWFIIYSEIQLEDIQLEDIQLKEHSTCAKIEGMSCYLMCTLPCIDWDSQTLFMFSSTSKFKLQTRNNKNVNMYNTCWCVNSAITKCFVGDTSWSGCNCVVVWEGCFTANRCFDKFPQVKHSSSLPNSWCNQMEAPSCCNGRK